ncbi:MAG: putative DNA binding domain-containing protein [Synergistes sp.]|nr:putative DNA binding domain-containing protein [Synergistes sp.]
MDQFLVEKVNELRAYKSEREWFEFKENRYEPRELGEYISAMSNSAAYEGKAYAYFIWGVQDVTHELTGTKFDPNRNVKGEPLKHFLARQISPDVDFRFEELVIEGKRVVVLVIPAAKTVPTSFSDERYIRIGSSKEKLRKYPERESFLFSVLREGFPTIENTASEYQDLTFEKVLIYYGAKGISLNMDQYKKNLGLYTADGKYNILAQLLSDDSHIPVRVAIFSGTKKSDNMYSVREFGHQCLLYTLDEILRYGDVLNILQADETNRIVERKDVPLFDNDAFREAIINAFLHNKWVEGNEPMITVFSDRIEILSRGTIPREQTIAGFFSGESVPVNKKLSEIFLQLHISEKTGRGVPKITEKYGKDAFEFNENSIVVRIPFNWINVMGDKAGNKRGNKPGNNEPMQINPNETQRNILKIIRDNPNVTKKQIQEMTGKGRTTVDNGIAFLKKNGFIVHIGSNKTGYWKVTED